MEHYHDHSTYFHHDHMYEMAQSIYPHKNNNQMTVNINFSKFLLSCKPIYTVSTHESVLDL